MIPTSLSSVSTSKQLIEDTRPPIGAKPGRVERYDYEYKRNGTRNLFMFANPRAGDTKSSVALPWTSVGWDEPTLANVVRLVLDNLNTHKFAREAFEPSEARRIAKRLSFTTLPNMAVG